MSEFGFDSAGIMIVHSLGGLYVFIVLLRFLLQVIRADFYNPLSQFVVKATHPLLHPLRRFIPSVRGLDLASLVLALAVQMVLLAATLLLAYGALPNPLALLAWSAIGILDALVDILFFSLIAMVILSWVAPATQHPAALLIHQICTPILRPIQRLMPDLGGIDLSPIFAFLSLQLLEMLVINNLAILTHMPQLLRQLM